MGAKPLRIWFEKLDRFIKTYDGIRFLVFFGSKRYYIICNRIRCLISKKGGITDISGHSFATKK